jgi:alpha-D-ribose 1-methylphosphonate 5-triphosphate diphosphatase
MADRRPGNPVALNAARVFSSEGEICDGWVTIEGSMIVEVGARPPAGVERVELGEADLLPGIVELHSDCLEERMRPRPGSNEPLAGALLQIDAEAISHGVTTHFVCGRVGNNPARMDDAEDAVRLVQAVERWKGRLRADTFIHLRVELTARQFELGAALARSSVVALMSYMDHSPGQGQFASEADWRRYYAGQMGAPEKDLNEILARQKALLPVIESRRARVAAEAMATGTTLASHDDDSTAAVARARELGVGISEFPINAEGLSAARRAGLGVVMGAPNARRGGSHMRGLSAREAVASGQLDGLVSDYHLPSLLAAPYSLAGAGICSLEEAIRLVTDGPARLVGLDDRGRIETGLRADLIAVGSLDGQPGVQLVIRNGTLVLGTGPGREGPAMSHRPKILAPQLRPV